MGREEEYTMRQNVGRCIELAAISRQAWYECGLAFPDKDRINASIRAVETDKSLGNIKAKLDSKHLAILEGDATFKAWVDKDEFLRGHKNY